MSKLSVNQALELKELVGDAANSTQLEEKAKEFGVSIPYRIIGTFRKWEKRNLELSRSNKEYSDDEYKKYRTERAKNVERILDWINKNTEQ